MEHSRNNRRTFLGGIIASIGTALSATTAFALPPGTQGLLGAATRLLRRFGVGVTARVDPELERDVLTFTIDPREGTQYDQKREHARGLRSLLAHVVFRGTCPIHSLRSVYGRAQHDAGVAGRQDYAGNLRPWGQRSGW